MVRCVILAKSLENTWAHWIASLQALCYSTDAGYEDVVQMLCFRGLVPC